MAYIQFELDALNSSASVAVAARSTQHIIIGGLALMWAHCFRVGVENVSKGQLLGFFGIDASQALCDFGFLKPANPENTEFFVCGAGRYLMAKESRKRGGIASKHNLVPGYKKAKKSSGAAELQPNFSRRAGEGQATQKVRLSSPLAPNTYNLTPNTKDKDPTFSNENVAAPSGTAPAWGDCVAAIKKTFENATGEKYFFAAKGAGMKAGSDGALLKSLLNQGFTIEEICRRYDHRLRSKKPDGSPYEREFWRLEKDFAGMAAPKNFSQKPKNPARGIANAEDQGWENYNPEAANADPF